MMRISPAVKRELPPASASGARSSTSTRRADSRAESAAHRAALPPPTTTTSQSAIGAALRGDANRGTRFSEYFTQHEGQDAAVLVVVDLDRRVDAQQQRHFLHAAVGSPDHERRVLLRPDLALDAANVQGLVAFDAQRRDRVAAFELERQHTHSHEIGAVDALEAAHDHRTNAEKQRA